MSVIENLVWARPAGWLLLLWIAWILWHLRQRNAPRVLATGTLELWQSVLGEGMESSQATRRRVPPRAWLWFLGLLCASLAVVDVRPDQAPRMPLHVFHLDRSPSMFLPVEASASDTRYDRALERTLAWLDDQDIPAQAREWRARGKAPVRGEAPPADWSTVPPLPEPEVSPEVLADAGLTVVTDHSRASAAGQVTSGGEAALGWVGERDGHALLWDGLMVRVDRAVPARSVAAGESFSGEVRQLFGLWAKERGLKVASREEAEHVFELDLGDSGEALQPRTVRVLPLAAEELSTDPAFWAVQWAERLDQALPSRPGVVALAERQPAGEPELQPAEPREEAAEATGSPPAAWLSLVSLLCALGALWPIRGRVRARGTGKGPRAGLAPSGRSL